MDTLAGHVEALTPLTPAIETAVRGELTAMNVPTAMQDEFIDALTQYTNAFRESTPGTMTWASDAPRMLRRVRMEAVSEAAFVSRVGAGSEDRVARVVPRLKDRSVGGDEWVADVLLQKGVGQETIYEELIHADRVLKAKDPAHASDPDLADVRKVMDAFDVDATTKQRKWDSMSAEERYDTHLAAAREEAKVRQLAIDHLDGLGTLTPAQEQALLRGIDGQQEADQWLEWLDDLPVDQRASYEQLDALGMSDPPGFYGGRTPAKKLSPDYYVKWKRYSIEVKENHKVNGRRKLTPGPRKAGEEHVIIEANDELTFKFGTGGQPPTTVAYGHNPKKKPIFERLHKRYPDGIKYSVDQEPGFVDVVGPNGETHAALYRVVDVEDQYPGATFDPTHDIVKEGYIRVELDASDPNPTFTLNRKTNMDNADDAVAALIPGWQKPEGFTWHEELHGDTAVLILVESELHGNVPHTGGVAKLRERK